MGELRIGDQERELAMGVLDEHMRAGRLDAREYAERSATASTARLRSELDALFTDLPAPHPAYPGVAEPTAPPMPGAPGDVPTPRTQAPEPQDDAPRTSRETDLPELVAPMGAALGRNAGKLMPLVPVVAIAIFVLSGFRLGVVFLLVPVAMAALAWLGHRHGS